MTNSTIIDVQDLKVHFPIYSKGLFRTIQGHVKAVDGVSFSLKKSETLGLVGESGSGKTTLGRAILRALKTTEGTIIFHDGNTEVDLLGLEGKQLTDFRRNMQLIFQDPYASLNPRMTIRDIIAEPLECLKLYPKDKINAKVREIAELCKINIEHLRCWPHVFSGGQRQRICIARALITRPKFVVCDEAVSALDVSIQADIINLLVELQQKLGLSYLFISHDLAVVAHISTSIAVLYVGRLVEHAPTPALFAKPLHPYTRALLSAIPTIDIKRELSPVDLAGGVPDPSNPPSGCRFHTRCPHVSDVCRRDVPKWQEWGKDHFVACHRVKEFMN